MERLEVSSEAWSDCLLPLREKVPEGRMRGWSRIRDVRDNPPSVSAFGRSTFSRKGRREEGQVHGAN